MRIISTIPAPGNDQVDNEPTQAELATGLAELVLTARNTNSAPAFDQLRKSKDVLIAKMPVKFEDNKNQEL